MLNSAGKVKVKVFQLFSAVPVLCTTEKADKQSIGVSVNRGSSANYRLNVNKHKLVHTHTHTQAQFGKRQVKVKGKTNDRAAVREKLQKM